jgi:hypothetical protein
LRSYAITRGKLRSVNSNGRTILYCRHEIRRIATLRERLVWRNASSKKTVGAIAFKMEMLDRVLCQLIAYDSQVRDRPLKCHDGHLRLRVVRPMGSCTEPRWRVPRQHWANEQFRYDRVRTREEREQGRTGNLRRRFILRHTAMVS